MVSVRRAQPGLPAHNSEAGKGGAGQAGPARARRGGSVQGEADGVERDRTGQSGAG